MDRRTSTLRLFVPASSPKAHTVVSLEKPAMMITTTMHELAPPPAVLPLPQSTSRLRSNRRSTPAFSSMLHSGSAASLGFLNSLKPRSISHRQRAEIQLEGLLNEPEESLPAFARRASLHLEDQEWSIDEVSKLLNTQPFIIERLVRALYSPSRRPSGESVEEERVKTLNKSQLQKLTRVLNSTMDVRALLFFMMLDEADDRYITREEIVRFYEKYLTHLKTFDNERLQEVISALLKKFHFDQVSRSPTIRSMFYSTVSFRNFGSTLKNSTTLFRKMPLSSKFSLNLPFIRTGSSSRNPAARRKIVFNDSSPISVGNRRFTNSRRTN